MKASRTLFLTEVRQKLITFKKGKSGGGGGKGAFLRLTSLFPRWNGPNGSGGDESFTSFVWYVNPVSSNLDRLPMPRWQKWRQL